MEVILVSLMLVLLRTHFPGCSLVLCLREEDVPGASLNGRELSQLLVVELKCWLKCRAATAVGKKLELVKR